MYTLCEPIGFGLVADSSLRGPEGFDSEVGWEGMSGVVVVLGHFFSSQPLGCLRW